MSTSWTQADIEALEAAIKRGVLRVRFADREIQYHSVSEMLSLLQSMKSAVDAESSTPVVRTTYARFRKGSE
jgi:hypothetical protein